MIFYNPADRGVVVVVVRLDWANEEAIFVEKMIINRCVIKIKINY